MELVAKTIVVAALLITATAMAQNNSPPSAVKPLSWTRIVHLRDGRTFVSDGAIALDAMLAHPSPSGQNLPEVSAQVVERYLSAEFQGEFTLSQLRRSGENHYIIAPNGIMLNAIYVDYLHRTLPEVRFRTKSGMEPIVIVLDGKPVGLLMPMKSVNP